METLVSTPSILCTVLRQSVHESVQTSTLKPPQNQGAFYIKTKSMKYSQNGVRYVAFCRQQRKLKPRSSFSFNRGCYKTTFLGKLEWGGVGLVLVMRGSSPTNNNQCLHTIAWQSTSGLMLSIADVVCTIRDPPGGVRRFS